MRGSCSWWRTTTPTTSASSCLPGVHSVAGVRRRVGDRAAHADVRGGPMSLIATLFVREGIVMAADSRLTINTHEQQGDSSIVHLAVGQSDSTYKVFLAPHDIGISTCGDADIQDVPIAGNVDSFIAASLQDQPS